MEEKKRKKSKTKKMGQLNLKYDLKFLTLLKKNAKKKGFTETQYIKDLVTKDGKALDNSDVTAISAQLHIIDSWQKKIFYTTDSLAKHFMRYMYESFKYMPDMSDPKYEAAERNHGIEKFKTVMNEYRASKNFYNHSFLEQMFKVVIETSSDFEKLNPMKSPDKDSVVKQRYYSLIRNEIKNISTIFTKDELEFISISCNAINWNEEKDIKHKLLLILKEAEEIEIQQSRLDRDKLGKKISELTQLQLFATVEYIEGFCELNCLTPIKENELFENTTN